MTVQDILVTLATVKFLFNGDLIDSVSTLDQFEKIKLLADPRRLLILRILLAGPASLTQIGLRLGQHPARVRHHMQKLESAGLVEMSSSTITKGVTEKFYRASAGAYLVHQMILPIPGKRPAVIFSGSHDMAVERLSQDLASHLQFLCLSIGSLDGLVSLRQGLCHFTGSHLLDADGEFNTPYVRRLLPDRSAQMVTLAHRQQGLILAQGNPKSIHNLGDLSRPDVIFINRQPGSGTRLWLDNQLKLIGLTPDQIIGYTKSVATHSEVARLVQTGQADAGVGLQASADRLSLDFIPLFTERYDLTLVQDNAALLAPLLDHLQTRSCRVAISSICGYDATHTGEPIQI